MGPEASRSSLQSAVSLTLRDSSRRSSKSFGRGVAARIRSSASTSRRVPIRHGTAFPHASFALKSAKKRAVSTMHVPESVTSTEPEPMMAPAASIAS